MKKLIGLAIAMVITITTIAPASAATITIDFEDLNHLDYIGTHYAGLTFDSNAQILQKPDYNWQNYPPYSGNNVFYNANSKYTRIDFASPVSRVSIWYTSAYNGYLEGYDSSGNLVSSANGGSNIGSNTKLEITGSNIAYVIVHDDGDFIAYDDLEYDTGASIPEFPTMALPVISALGIVLFFSRKKN